MGDHLTRTSGEAQLRQKKIRKLLGRQVGMPVFYIPCLQSDVTELSNIFRICIAKVSRSEVVGKIRCLKDDKTVASVLWMLATFLDNDVDQNLASSEQYPIPIGLFSDNIFRESQSSLISIFIRDFSNVFGVRIGGVTELLDHYERGLVLLRRMSNMQIVMDVFSMFPILLCGALSISTAHLDANNDRDSSVGSVSNDANTIAGKLEILLSKWLHILGMGTVSIGDDGKGYVNDWVAHLVACTHICRSLTPYTPCDEDGMLFWNTIDQEGTSVPQLSFQDVEYLDISRVTAILEATRVNLDNIMRDRSCSHTNLESCRDPQVMLIKKLVYSKISYLVNEKGLDCQVESMRKCIHHFNLLKRSSSFLGEFFLTCMLEQQIQCSGREKDVVGKESTLGESSKPKSSPSDIVERTMLMELCLASCLGSGILPELYAAEIESDIMHRVDLM